MFGWLFKKKKEEEKQGADLAPRCRAYLEKGPPKQMTNYVPGSLTEMVIACGAEGKPLDTELQEIAGIIEMESEEYASIEDPEVRAYMQEGASLVKEVLARQEGASPGEREG